MTGLCGWIGGPAEPAAVAAERAGRMAASLARLSHKPHRCALGPTYGLVTCGESATAFLHEEDGLVLAVFGHPRLVDEPRGASDGEGFMGRAVTLARRDPASLLEHLRGDFSLAVIDSRSGRALLATDRMGIRPVFYFREGAVLLFASSIEPILLGLGRVPALSRQSLLDYLYFHVVPGPQTVYEGVKRLLPAHALRTDSSTETVLRYWQPRFTETRSASVAQLKPQFELLLHEGVRPFLNGETVGAFLSGGTDSSTVTGLACELTKRRVPAYSIGFAVAGYDEMRYARIAARHFGADHREHYVGADDVADAIPIIARAYDQPFGNASAMPTFFCARAAARDGIGRLLAGDGGDELFGGNARYAKQAVFALYGGLPTVLRRGVLEPLFAGSHAAAKVPLIRKMRSYIEQARLPMPDRTETYNLLARIGAANMLTADFLQGVSDAHPLELLRSAYASVEARSLINRMLALDWRFTLADNDLPKVTRTCELAGVDVVFPLLADELVEFSAALPPRFKLRGTTLRYFFKEALRGFLPDEIIRKRKHGFGLPFGTWIQQEGRLRSYVFDQLGDLRSRGIVRPEFLDELMDSRLRDHGPYFGSLAWVLMMLELWFKEAKALSSSVGRAS